MIVQLATLRHIYDTQEPLATVYMQALPVSADAEHEVRLRWDALRRQLADAGAHQEALDALDETIMDTEAFGAVQAEGRVLVAGSSGLLLDEDFDATGEEGDQAVLAPVAQLGDYLRQRLRSVRALVVLVDQKQATIRREIFTSNEVLDTGSETHVEGSADESVHKPREGALHHRKIQQRADDAAAMNIRDVSEALRKITDRWKPDLIAVAGEVQGRKLLLDELRTPLAEIAYEVESGGSADAGAEQALADELTNLARRACVGAD